MTNLEKLTNFALGLGCKVLLNEPMKNHTTFRIGGPADLFIETKCDNLPEIIAFSKKCNINYFIIGKGSNLLISDEGLSGAVIRIKDDNGLFVNGNKITVHGGVKLSKLCNFAMENSLSGLEFAFGIPGSVGGALFMNAGAYGGEMKDVVSSAKSLSDNGFVIRNINDMKLGYRTSCYKSNGEIITEITFELTPDDKSKIKERMDDFISRRTSKQPLEYPSAGSTFKRPEGYFAAALIEECGLKGYSVGGAMVSEKHSGFVINFNNASCKDVQVLMKHIKDTVFAQKEVLLEPEVIFKGRE